MIKIKSLSDWLIMYCQQMSTLFIDVSFVISSPSVFCFYDFSCLSKVTWPNDLQHFLIVCKLQMCFKIKFKLVCSISFGCYHSLSYGLIVCCQQLSTLFNVILFPKYIIIRILLLWRLHILWSNASWQNDHQHWSTFC